MNKRPKAKLDLPTDRNQGPVVQSIVSLTSSLVVKMLTANAKATHIFSAKILAYMPYLMIKVLMIR